MGEGNCESCENRGDKEDAFTLAGEEGEELADVSLDRNDVLDGHEVEDEEGWCSWGVG